MIPKHSVLNEKWVEERGIKCELCISPAYADYFDEHEEEHYYCEKHYPVKNNLNKLI